MPNKTFSKTFFAYIKNDPNELYKGYKTQKGRRQTGWHIIPNQDYNTYMHPIDRIKLNQSCTWFKPVHTKTTIGHTIPLTDTAALGGTGSILTFNNTIYTLIWPDQHDIMGKEVDGKDDFDFNQQTEGILYDDNTKAIKGKAYHHNLPNHLTKILYNSTHFTVETKFIFYTQEIMVSNGHGTLQKKTNVITIN